MGCLVIVEEAADAGLLLVFSHLFSEDFQLQLHKVDLLLQVDYVLICWVDVGIVSELARSQLLLVLPSEIHGNGL